MNTLGEILRHKREAKKLLLRQVAAALEMDTALLSNSNGDERKPNKEQVMAFGTYYEINPDELLLAWLSDKIASEIQDEALASQVLKAVEKKIELLKKKKKQ